jgi:hypothetical protein
VRCFPYDAHEEEGHADTVRTAYQQHHTHKSCESANRENDLTGTFLRFLIGRFLGCVQASLQPPLRCSCCCIPLRSHHRSCRIVGHPIRSGVFRALIVPCLARGQKLGRTVTYRTKKKVWARGFPPLAPSTTITKPSCSALQCRCLATHATVHQRDPLTDLRFRVRVYSCDVCGGCDLDLQTGLAFTFCSHEHQHSLRLRQESDVAGIGTTQLARKKSKAE